jgi:predicted RND superfamily exporter protein
MREQFLKNLAKWHTGYPWRMLTIAIVLTVLLWGAATQLTVTMRTSDLLPANDPKVVQFNKIIDEFNTATNLVVVVQGEEDQIKAFADQLAPKIEQLHDASENDHYHDEIIRLKRELQELKEENGDQNEIEDVETEINRCEKRIDMKIFQRVDYKAEVNFLRKHALMLVKEEDLKNIKDIYTNPNLSDFLTNLNNSMEKEYVGQEESISNREKEDGAVAFLDGIRGLVHSLKKGINGVEYNEGEIESTADNILFGDPYMLSYDKKALILIAVPSFTLMDRDLIMVATDRVQTLVDEMLPDFPGVVAGLSGDIAKEHDEQIYSEQALSVSTVFALIIIFILLVISFRMWVAPIFAILTLIVGVIWALGTSAVVVGQLNMVTSMMSVVLLGLGIDFAIHIISGFTEWRASGDNIRSAMEQTFLKSGKGVITGALTTACAFLTLMISDARGMSEMGLVTGIGLISILLATLFFLPVLLVFRERRIENKRAKKSVKEPVVQRDISFRFLGNMGLFLSKHYVVTILSSVIVTAILVWAALQMRFDTDFRNLEPEGLKSIALMDTVLEKFDLSIQYAFLLADNVEESRTFAKECRDLASVAITNDISVYLPSPAEQEKRIPHIDDVYKAMKNTAVSKKVTYEEIQKLAAEINRLQMNVIEMQDMAFLGGQDKVDNKCKTIVGDPDNLVSENIIDELLQLLEEKDQNALAGLSVFQRQFAPHYKQSVMQMCSLEPIKIEFLPETILDRYCNRDRNLFLVTVYPIGDMWQEDVLYSFVENLEGVSEKATGVAPMALALMDVFARDGQNAILLTLLIVFLLLWVDLKGIRYALMAMLPLACGVFWMVGLMYLSGIMLSIMTVIALPMIVGIGIDDGVHIMHRWRSEGNGNVKKVFSSTGKAIFLTSLTTGFAFGSLVFSVFRGWAQFGGALAIGVGACFLTTVIVLPGIIGFLTREK